VRLQAFGAAVEAVVRPGDTVLDLASGSGILGLLACRAGAIRVYSVEVGAMIEVARELARENGYGDRVHFIKGFSTHVSIPERVDVVVADQIGNFGFNAGIIEYFADARARFLRAGGLTIPQAIELIVCPLEAGELFANVEFWNTGPAGFDFSRVRPLAANTGYQVDLAAQSMLGAPVSLMSISLNSDNAALLQSRVRAMVSRRGTLHGLGGWFDAELAAGIRMTNSPLSPNRIKRRQIYFPIDRPADVGEGDAVDIRMTIRPSDLLVGWTVEVYDAKSGAKKAASRHSTWKGMLADREDLERTRPDFVPTLSPRGQARRTVVELCDSTRTVAQIEDETWERHPGLFKSRSEVAEFVAEVVTRYAR